MNTKVTKTGEGGSKEEIDKQVSLELSFSNNSSKN